MSEKTITKEVTEDGVTERITVEKVEGGYIITKCKYGSGEDGKYIDETKKMVSTTNPFKEEGSDKEEKSDKMFDFVDKPLISFD